MSTVIIRQGIKEDLSQVFELVKELAEYERAPLEVTNTISEMEKDGFGNNPIFGFFVAEKGKKIIGLSLYYHRYSTWKGRRLFLEDIIVTESERGKGIGKLLFERTMARAAEDNINGMVWQVLEWNEPSISFYKKYAAKFDSEWINCSLEKEQLKDWLNK